MTADIEANIATGLLVCGIILVVIYFLAWFSEIRNGKIDTECDDCDGQGDVRAYITETAFHIEACKTCNGKGVI